MTQDDPVPAVAYLRTDRSGSSANLHERWLCRLAIRFGYELRSIVRAVDATTETLAFLEATIERHRAEAVFVPTIDHLGGQLHRIVALADVIEQNGVTYARWSPIIVAVSVDESLEAMRDGIEGNEQQ